MQYIILNTTDMIEFANGKTFNGMTSGTGGTNADLSTGTYKGDTEAFNGLINDGGWTFVSWTGYADGKEYIFSKA